MRFGLLHTGELLLEEEWHAMLEPCIEDMKSSLKRGFGGAVGPTVCFESGEKWRPTVSPSISPSFAQLWPMVSPSNAACEPILPRH